MPLMVSRELSPGPARQPAAVLLTSAIHPDQQHQVRDAAMMLSQESATCREAAAAAAEIFFCQEGFKLFKTFKCSTVYNKVILHSAV